MPLNNLSDQHFSTAEMNTVRTLLDALHNVLSPKSRNLSPAERQELGSINEQNKLVVHKVRDYRQQQPGLSSPQIDWNEFEADFTDRNFLEELVNRLRSLLDMSIDAKILHDHDVYKTALNDYRYTRYMAGTEAPGYDVKMDDIRRLFPSTGLRRNKGEPPADANGT